MGRRCLDLAGSWVVAEARGTRHSSLRSRVGLAMGSPGLTSDDGDACAVLCCHSLRLFR